MNDSQPFVGERGAAPGGEGSPSGLEPETELAAASALTGAAPAWLGSMDLPGMDGDDEEL